MTNQEINLINDLINSVNANSASIEAIIHGLNEKEESIISNSENILALSERLNHLGQNLLAPLAERLLAMEQNLTALTDITHEISTQLNFLK